MNQPLNSTERTLKIHLQNEGKIDLPVTDLMFLQATGNYTWLYWKDGQRMLLPRTLKYYEPKLPGGWFVRPHRNCIVNIQYVNRMEQISSDQGGLIYLNSGAVLPVSRRRWVAIRKVHQRLLLTNRYPNSGIA